MRPQLFSLFVSTCVLLSAHCASATTIIPFETPYEWIYDIPADAAGTGQSFDVAVGVDGTIHAVYWDEVEEMVVYAQKAIGGDWYRDNVQPAPTSEWPFFLPPCLSLALDAAGLPHIAIGDSKEARIYVCSRVEGGWDFHLDIGLAENDWDPAFVHQIELICTDSNILRLMYMFNQRDWQAPDQQGPRQLVYHIRAAGFWSEFIMMIDLFDSLGEDFDFVIGPDGMNHLSYYWSGDLQVRKFDLNSAGLASGTLPVSGTPGKKHSIAVDLDGRVHLAFLKMNSDGVSRDLFLSHTDFSLWSTPQLLFHRDERYVLDVQLALGSDPDPVVAFTHVEPADFPILIRRPRLDVLWGGDFWRVVSEPSLNLFKVKLALDSSGYPFVNYGQSDLAYLAYPRFRRLPATFLAFDIAHADRSSFATTWSSAVDSTDAYDYGDSKNNNGNHYGQGSFDSPDGNPHSDGWYAIDMSSSGVGEFGALWEELPESGSTPWQTSSRWAFINDGVVVPGLPPAVCMNWCYGPGGYVVDASGGLAGVGETLYNEIRSPAIAFSAPPAGALLRFEAYVHEPLDDDSPGMFLVWRIRSTASPDTLDLLTAPWKSRNEALHGGPWSGYIERDISTLLEPGAKLVQVGIGVIQMGQEIGLYGMDATPGPYIDNVGIVVEREDFRPAMLTQAPEQAQDAFPQSGILDLADLGSNAVRFDTGRSFNLGAARRAGSPGDSVSVSIKSLDPALDPGVPPADIPSLVYQLSPNPLFDLYRTSGLSMHGEVPLRESVTDVDAAPVWLGDLPDEGFLFPGDLIHYYYIAEDDLGRVSTIPADTTGFSVFPGDPGYHPFVYPLEYSMRALPTLSSVAGDQPSILIWFDRAPEESWAAWATSLANLGMLEGTDFDFYSTNSPGSGLGNGLNRAATDQLAGYETIIYTSGHHTRYTLASVEAGNPGNDVGVLDAWLRLGGRNLLLFGDNLASELGSSSTVGDDFLETWVGVSASGTSVFPVVHENRPNVIAMIPNDVITDGLTWWVDALPQKFTIDAVECSPGTTRLALFADGNGAPGPYTLSAASHHHDTDYDADVVLFPHTFAAIRSESLGARTQILSDILDYFSFAGGSTTPTSTSAAKRFASSASPNPFNARLNVVYSLPATARLKAVVYDLKGRLVRVLADEIQPAGDGRLVWDGKDGRGSTVASGAYLLRVEAGEQANVHRVCLVK